MVVSSSSLSPSTTRKAPSDDFLFREIATSVAIGAAALVSGAVLVSRGLRPLLAVESAAAQITAGDLDRRVPGATERTEVGRVALSLNGMLDRLHAMLDERAANESRLRRFVADASHELRTPSPPCPPMPGCSSGGLRAMRLTPLA